MIKSQESRDFDLARQLYQEDNHFGLSENAIIPKHRDKEKYKPRTLIDQTLELIDPTPNIHTLFVQFNERFFWNILLPVEIKWSSRMTSCAGICSFHPRNRQCIISLSAPLLKLRPRKDLVETLLHEMIHGYLFLTNNNRDRDGHGPEFCKHMDRINKAAGTKITIYHSFHDEVKLYKQHWWRCNGPCQKKAPYFGTVRRAMNRAPGPNDFWWKEHQQTCNGQFIKIKEPENFKAKGSKNKEKVKPAAKSNGSTNNMFNWLTKPTSTITVSPSPSTSKTIKPIEKFSNSQNGLKKLGNNTNNVHGWGTGGPNGSNGSNSSPKTTSVSGTPTFSCSGILGGFNTGRSNLLSKFDNSNKRRKLNTNTEAPKNTINTFVKSKSTDSTNRQSNGQLVKEVKLIECPVCSNFVSDGDVNKHLDSCLMTTGKKSIHNVSNTKKQKNEKNCSSAQKRKIDVDTFSKKQPELDNLKVSNCPVCNKIFNLKDINDHLDNCLSQSDTDCKTETKNDSIISLSSSSSDDLSLLNEESKDLQGQTPVSKFQTNNTTEADSHKCLVCNTFIPLGTSLNDHLEDCIGSVFNDDSTLSIDCDNKEVSETALETSCNQSDTYPCPVCMELVLQSFMNRHLDVCLKST
ncbi:PREDICTED: sprT-like domain-containing protein Spartan [Dufourea novaeangliae]|uniref:sprT-like domain-containing protein Spartan n=1 Tax=Dufourea novaeangliae TaxID=178035 RepID=UPI000767330D|nr:PREDICTED: sprT-like domain-containing protein Spartan [Dufourea novaeangliae]